MNQTAPRVITIPPKPKLAKEKAVQRQLRVAAYCRVSTDDEEQLTSYEAQQTYYTDKIMSNPNWTMAGIFPDEGITGTSAKKRPEFLKMIRLCKKKKIDLILTKSISRFARNTVDCLNYIRALKELGIAVVFEKENINTMESDSEILITMMGAFAQAESESISANVRWGKRQAMREGKVSFQYTRLYGYKRGEDNKPCIIPEQAEVVRRIFDAYLAGDSVRAIKQTLEADGIPSSKGGSEWPVGTIQGILRNEKYCGDALMQKTYISDCISRKVIKNTGQLPMYLVQDNHEAIIDRTIFDRTQAEIARRAGTRAPSKKNSVSGLSCYSSKYALTERLVCGECGTLYRRCTWSKPQGKRIVWRCISRIDYGKKYCRASPAIDEAPLQTAILAAVNTLMSDRSTLIGQVTNAIQTELSPVPGESMSIADVEKRIAELNAKTTELMAVAKANGGYAAYAEQFKAIMDEAAGLKDKKAYILKQQQENKAAALRITKAAEIMQNASPELTEWDESAIRQLVDTVTVLSKDRIRVTLRGGAEMEQELII
ncbi:MAG: recombinase family protein [Petrimonas sp.]|nr:recombinase family protein [Petrimonas sp.]